VTEPTERVGAVSSSSPLIGLAAIGRLHLLERAFRIVAIPEAAWAEVVTQGRGQPGEREVREAPWIRVAAVQDRPAVHRLIDVYDLQRGEAEAIQLTTEIQAPRVILDDRAARRFAAAASPPRKSQKAVRTPEKPGRSAFQRSDSRKESCTWRGRRPSAVGRPEGCPLR